MDRIIDYESVDGGSNPSRNTNLRVWCNGSIPVSKTDDEGSNPSARAN